MTLVVTLRILGLSGGYADSRLSYLKFRHQRERQVLRKVNTTLKSELCVVAHACNSSTWGTERGGLL